MKSKVFLAAVLVGFMAVLAPVAFAANPAWVLIEGPLAVDAQGAVTLSSEILVDGWDYMLEASGTYDANAGITADAEYSSGPPSYVWQDFVEQYESYGECLLELRVNGDCVEWGPYTGSHIYTLGYIGNGSTVSFDINDIAASNNVGALDVNIFATPVMVFTEISSGPSEVNVGELNCWQISITVKAMYGDVTNVVVQDGMGADLDANSTPVSISQGTATISKKTVGQGKQKMRATMVTWNVGDMSAGDTETLVVEVCTGLNAKHKQEFTTAEQDHPLDGGASATYYIDAMQYVSPKTDPVTVNVVKP